MGEKSKKKKQLKIIFINIIFNLIFSLHNQDSRLENCIKVNRVICHNVYNVTCKIKNIENQLNFDL